MNHAHVLVTGLITLLLASPAFAQDLGDRIDHRLDRKGDRIENRLDRKGDKIDYRLDRRGDRIEQKLDRKGNRINNRLDRKAERAEAAGHDKLAERLDRKGNRIDNRLDRQGNRIDRQGNRGIPGAARMARGRQRTTGSGVGRLRESPAGNARYPSTVTPDARASAVCRRLQFGAPGHLAEFLMLPNRRRSA